MNILIIGHAKHGKDYAANLIAKNLNLKFKPTTPILVENIIYPKLKHLYKSPQDCLNDKNNMRPIWFNILNEYAKHDKTSIAKLVLNHSNIYTGMRDVSQLNHCIKHDLFNLIIWIDASKRLPPEPNDSFNISPNYANIIIDNNYDIKYLNHNISKLCEFIKNFNQ